jgi:hypothetical protein
MKQEEKPSEAAGLDGEVSVVNISSQPHCTTSQNAAQDPNLCQRRDLSAFFFWGVYDGKSVVLCSR